MWTCHKESFITARKSSGGKVMFSQACVVPSVHRWGVRWQGICIGEGGLHPWGLGRPPPPIGYYGIRSTSGRYASYWNAFLCFGNIPPIPRLRCERNNTLYEIYHHNIGSENITTFIAMETARLSLSTTPHSFNIFVQKSKYRSNMLKNSQAKNKKVDTKCLLTLNTR